MDEKERGLSSKEDKNKEAMQKGVETRMQRGCFFRFSNFPIANFCFSLRFDYVFAFGFNDTPLYNLIIKSSFGLMLELLPCNPGSLN